MSLLLYCTICTTIAFVMIVVTLLISEYEQKSRETASPFECGFDPKIPSRLPFSTRFFLLAVIFLIFDIELVLLIPIPLSTTFYYMFFMMTLPLIFFILLLGLLHEWFEGSLDWAE
uniref:NADH dehydrogenase subunit 3 n=1 Tax=Iheyomytilidicola lauensis TaxID=998671 RepID=UPI001EE0AF12|nr:NADH dehydrogenase subunit 3 [Iheyomytilidicola lauensis]UJV31450.1 NADH dehydrogenase subunit 3 [Iheyomytilidicola lauensis]